MICGHCCWACQALRQCCSPSCCRCALRARGTSTLYKARSRKLEKVRITRSTDYSFPYCFLSRNCLVCLKVTKSTTITSKAQLISLNVPWLRNAGSPVEEDWGIRASQKSKIIRRRFFFSTFSHLFLNLKLWTTSYSSHGHLFRGHVDSEEVKFAHCTRLLRDNL